MRRPSSKTRRFGTRSGTSRRPAGPRLVRLRMEELEDRIVPSAGDSLASAILLVQPSGQQSARQDIQLSQATINAGAATFYRLVVAEPGNLNATVDAVGAPLSLSLYTSAGLPIVRSDGQSATNPNPKITQGLLGTAADGGTVYFLKVTNRGSAAATYSLSASLTPSASQLNTTPLGAASPAVASGDFDGDGQLDLIAGGFQSVALLLGNADGTFRPLTTFAVGFTPSSVLTGDFNGDGQLDVIAVGVANDGVDVLLGTGDGSFQSPITVAGVNGEAAALGDFNGDGSLDVAVTSLFGQTLVVCLGDGTGGFQALPPIPLPDYPSGVVAGDFDGDGRIDLAVSGSDTNRVTLFLGGGDGTFAVGSTAETGEAPYRVVAADLNGDGRLDLVTANVNAATVSVLLAAGDGTFATATSYAVGQSPRFVVAGDFDGDGSLDLATANYSSNDATLLFNRGDGTFGGKFSVPAGAGPVALVAGDFNGDGELDLVSDSLYSKSVTVLLGQGSGTFPTVAPANKTGISPSEFASGDFNGDGRLDLAVANSGSGDVTIILGQADGTFQNAGTVAVQGDPKGIVAGDFNGDGRLDLATANTYSMSLTVLLGGGDGSFLVSKTLPVDGAPRALAIGDFNRDGRPDLALALQFTPDFNFGNSVALLLGDGRGSFTAAGTFQVGDQPVSVVAGDFNGDRNLDLAFGNYYSRSVTVLLGNGTGGFGPGTNTAIGSAVTALAVGDFNGDLRSDLAVASRYYDNVSLLIAVGDGSFTTAATFDPGARLSALSAGDFNGDGYLDLAASADLITSTFAPGEQVFVYIGDGSGGLSSGTSYTVGSTPAALIARDFNGDGKLDMAAAAAGPSTVALLMGLGNGDFVGPSLAPGPLQSTPVVADLSGDGAPDSAVLNRAGQILFRRGLPGQSGAFAPPVVLNPDPGSAARDLALVRDAGGGFLLAALNPNGTSNSPGPTSSRTAHVTLYRPDAAGSLVAFSTIELPSDPLPANIASADLNGDGLGDLVVAGAATNQVFVLLQESPGVFGAPAAYLVGVNPSSITLKDVNGDAAPDILVTSRYSGQVSLLLNGGAGSFNPEDRYHDGTGMYGLTDLNGTVAVQSLEGSAAMAAGDFDGRPGADLTVVNKGTGNLALLSGDGLGGFFNPTAGGTLPAGSSASAVVAGQFDTRDPTSEIAILDADHRLVRVYRISDEGKLLALGTYGAGNQPTGLSVADVSRPGGGAADGIPDLLVGNSYGDLLILTGNGDGTFTDYRRADPRVSLAVATSGTNQPRTFFFSDRAADELGVGSAPAGTPVVAGASVFQDRTAGIQSPGPQQVVDVLGSRYLAVVNSGANSLLIYSLDSNGMPIPDSRQVYFTGTDPVGLTVTTSLNDLNGDSIPDVVIPNQGSNDVSVFLGSQTDGVWTLDYRPRQSSGGIGPTSVQVANVTGAGGVGSIDTSPDLIVSNTQSNRVNVLPNQGDGFFASGPASGPAFDVGTAPGQLFVGNFDANPGLDLVTVNSGTGSLTLISSFDSTPAVSTIFAGTPFSLTATTLNTAEGESLLLVANASEGFLEVYGRTTNGFDVVASFDQSAVPFVSSLAVVPEGDRVEIYGTDAGSHIAYLLGTFGPEAPEAPPPSSSGPFGPELPDLLPAVPGLAGGLQVVASLPSLLTSRDGADPGAPDSTATGDDGFVSLLLSSVALNTDPSLLPNDQFDEFTAGEPDTTRANGTEVSDKNKIFLLNVEAEQAAAPADRSPEKPAEEIKEIDPAPEEVTLPWNAYAISIEGSAPGTIQPPAASGQATTKTVQAVAESASNSEKTGVSTNTAEAADAAITAVESGDTEPDNQTSAWRWGAVIIVSLWYFCFHPFRGWLNGLGRRPAASPFRKRRRHPQVEGTASHASRTDFDT